MLWIGSTPLTSLGLRPNRLAGWLTGARAERTFVGVPGTVGQVAGERVAPKVRTAQIGATVPLTHLSEREAAIARVERALQGLLPLRTIDRPTVQTWCECVDIAWGELPEARGLTVPLITCTMTFVAVDGGSEDVTPSAPIALGTSATAIPLGTLPSGGWLCAWGGSSPLTLTYTPANGVDATTLVITQTLGTGEHLACDLDRQDVWVVTAIGRTRASSVTGTWPALDPAHQLGSAAPTLTLSSGSGLLLTRKRWRI